MSWGLALFTSLFAAYAGYGYIYKGRYSWHEQLDDHDSPNDNSDNHTDNDGTKEATHERHVEEIALTVLPAKNVEPGLDKDETPAMKPVTSVEVGYPRGSAHDSDTASDSDSITEKSVIMDTDNQVSPVDKSNKHKRVKGVKKKKKKKEY